jgi:hypothetical protein
VNAMVVCAEDCPFEAVPTSLAVYRVAGARMELSQLTSASGVGLAGHLKLPPALSKSMSYCTVPSKMLLMVNLTERSLLATAVALGVLQQHRCSTKESSQHRKDSPHMKHRSAQQIQLAHMQHKLTLV